MKNKYLIILVIIVLPIAFVGYELVSRVGIDKTVNIDGVADSNGVDGNDNQLINSQISNYRNYSVEEFEKAKAEGKVVMLYFTANWCPTCRVQIPVNEEAFKEFENDENVAIFKVHILDSVTTDETERLAKEYGVRLQHTFIILDSGGEVVFTHTGPLVKEDIVKELSAVIN